MADPSPRVVAKARGAGLRAEAANRAAARSHAARIPGHALVAEGAPFERRGHRLIGKGGRALCECGELSPPLANTSRRKAWHRDEHKPAVRRG